MTGYASSLILEMRAEWWPSTGDLPQHPVDAGRSLASLLADVAMPLAVHSSVIPSTGLSRMGRSTLSLAAWDLMDEDDVAPHIRVYDPMRGARVLLPVCTALTSQEVIQSRPSLRSLVEEERVRLVPRQWPDKVPRLVPFSAEVSKENAEGVSPSLLFQEPEEEIWQSALAHLESQQADGKGISLSPAAVQATLIRGGHGGCLTALKKRLQRRLPSGPCSIGEYSFLVEHRNLNMADVLTLDEREVLEVFSSLCRPPLTQVAPKTDDPTKAFFPTPCVVLCLDHVELLEEGANNVTSFATHHLCACLDQLRNRHWNPHTTVVLWSFATDVSSLPASLALRLGDRSVSVLTSTASDLSAFYGMRLSQLGNGSVAEQLLAGVVDRVGALSFEDHLRLTNTQLEALCSEVAQQQQRNAGLAGIAQSPYAHLYGVDDAISRIEELVVWPLTHLRLLHELTIPCSKGILVCGASGTGKTALLAALAERLKLPDARGIHVISVDGLSLIEKEVGRSEKNIANLFEVARSSAPTCLFIDNLDALAPPRGRVMSEGNNAADRTLSTLLTQMDGVGGDTSRALVVVASAPHIQTLDGAVCRPGRLDVHVTLQVPPLDASIEAMAQRVDEFCARFLQERMAMPVSDVWKGSVRECSEAFLGARSQPFKSGTESSTAVTPAEVVAAVREVMLTIVEENGRREKLGQKRDLTEDEMIALIRDAFEAVRVNPVF